MFFLMFKTIGMVKNIIRKPIIIANVIDNRLTPFNAITTAIVEINNEMIDRLFRCLFS